MSYKYFNAEQASYARFRMTCGAKLELPLADIGRVEVCSPLRQLVQRREVLLCVVPDLPLARPREQRPRLAPRLIVLPSKQ